jgi:outer membrane receptor protein involved in Fe transport
LEAEIGYRPVRRLTALAAYAYVEPVVTEAPGHEELVGKDLPQDPRHRATAALARDDRRIVTASVQLRVVGRQYEDDRNELPLGAAAVVDLFVARELARGLAAFAAVENLLDREYLVGRAGVDTVGQPFTLRAGLRWRG